MKKITTDDAVRALKKLGVSSTAKTVASLLCAGESGAVSSRSVATALRGAVDDGRVKSTWRKGGQVARYRFVRLTAKPVPELPTEFQNIPEKYRAALLAVLYGHQGGSSLIGQPIRKMLGIGEFDCLTLEHARIGRETLHMIEVAIEPMPRGSAMHDTIAGTVSRLKRYSKQGDNKNNLLGQTMEEAAAFIQRALAAGVR